MKRGFMPLLACLLACTAPIGGKEVLLHEGPEVSTPKLTMHLPEGDIDVEKDPLIVVKRFFVDSEVLEKLSQDVPDVSGKRPVRISARQAIDKALESIDPGDGVWEVKVMSLERLEKQPGLPGTFAYFLIGVSVNGSEEHRVVLMDGTVIRPRISKKK